MASDWTAATAPTARPAGEIAHPLLEAVELVKHFPIKSGLLGQTKAVVRAVDGITFSLYQGETLGIVGESGCGKSTTARVLMNLIPPDSGNVLLNGRAPGTPELSLKAFRSQVQMVFQDSYASLNPRMTVEDSIAYGPTVHGLPSNDAVRRARRLLDRVGLNPRRFAAATTRLSGGQRQRVTSHARSRSKPRSSFSTSGPARQVRRGTGADLLLDLKKRSSHVHFISHDLEVVRSSRPRHGHVSRPRRRDRTNRHALHRRPSPYTSALLGSICRWIR